MPKRNKNDEHDELAKRRKSNNWLYELDELFEIENIQKKNAEYMLFKSSPQKKKNVDSKVVLKPDVNQRDVFLETGNSYNSFKSSVQKQKNPVSKVILQPDISQLSDSSDAEDSCKYGIEIWENEENCQLPVKQTLPEQPEEFHIGRIKANLKFLMQQLKYLSGCENGEQHANEIFKSLPAQVWDRASLKRAEIAEDLLIAEEFIEARRGQLEQDDKLKVYLYNVLENKLKKENNPVLLTIVLHLENKFRQLNAADFAALEAAMKAELCF
ncbi:RXT2_N domain-containing protein [Caenorhabditis elegans]|uniref:RXT2_N domain-containing protein n=1 Tax=Caenorhabditis elegans TaxID=6239 RepID=Q22733_CAEEL|nr:RXT2_N domain-containing protein [Caenorhabditis elegans]CAA92017.1 RXT2_N domain-containing protein [Caenorhabditis elegans]|eukprot:NP_510103.1 Uncharacterized protein CELE_T24D5.3 [Caenorhabditis elegans]